MITASLEDSLFPHAATASNGGLNMRPKHVRFDRSKKKHALKFFTDKDLASAAGDLSTVKIAWLLESPDLFTGVYEDIRSIHYLKYFDFVFTHNRELLKGGPKFVFSPFGGTWISKDEWQIFPKNRGVSMVASEKTILEGHKLRHEVVAAFRHRIDSVMGRGYGSFDDKIDSLRDFRYSIVIENCREDYWFTEKLIDCFLTGTVPIYWGCPSIGDFFDPNGIITFHTLADLDSILDNLSDADYDSRHEAIERNFKTAHDYAVTEDYIYDHILTVRPEFKQVLSEVSDV